MGKKSRIKTAKRTGTIPLTDTMRSEVKRLTENVVAAQQRMNDFLNYCKRELKVPSEWPLDLQSLTFILPAAAMNKMKKSKEGK